MPTAGQLITALEAAQATKVTQDSALAVTTTAAATADTTVYAAAVEIGLIVTPMLKDTPSLSGFIEGLARAEGTDTVSTHTKRLQTLALALKGEFVRHSIDWSQVS